MEEYVLKTINLSKEVKGKKIVDNICMNIKKGDIYGFIGENGAGKTSFIRLITGLSKISCGNLILSGKDTKSDIEDARKRMGTLIEVPAVFEEMTAYQNLDLLRIQKGIPGKESIENVLEMVNLKNYENKKVKNFSLGMKQKLAIAQVLLGDPEFLILDEPINGLDPVAIIEIRELLKKLNKEKNITILISSHILKELDQLANTYGVIKNGKLIKEFTHKDLIERCRKSLDIKVNDTNKCMVILENELKTNNFIVKEDNTIKLYDFIDEPGKVSTVLSKNEVIIEQISTSSNNLEDYFMDLVGGVENV